jgi:alkanesulfonate monooxygenase SsuD/methylene tetrahydromethanopterin reductase-like flavin-dependent oxidoreductase (luciferase family)
LLIGGGGERRTLRIAAQYAGEWNDWTTPDVLAHKLSVLRQHCEQVGRDPAEIHVSTQALLYLSTDKQWLEEKRQQAGQRPAIVGTPDEVAEIVARYRDSGADELIVPDFTLGSLSRKKETCDLFMQEVAPAFR